MYGHIRKLAEAEKAGIEAAGGSADLYQLVFHPSQPPLSFSKCIVTYRVQETLPQEVLSKMYAPPQDKAIPFIDPQKLASYDVSQPTPSPVVYIQLSLLTHPRPFFSASQPVMAISPLSGKPSGTPPVVSGLPEASGVR